MHSMFSSSLCITSTETLHIINKKRTPNACFTSNLEFAFMSTDIKLTEWS